MMTEPGVYNDVTAGTRGLQEKESGALELQIECLVPDGSRIIAFQYLVGKSGAVNTRTVSNLKEAIGWDGRDFEYLVSGEWPAFQMTVEAEEYQGKTRNKVAWINPNNSQGGAAIATGDLKALQAKYGSMFRATSPAPVKPVGAAKAPPPAPKKAAPGPVSTQEECWELLQKAYPDSMHEALEEMWFKEVKKITKKDSENCTPEDWGKVKADFAKLTA